MYCETYLLEGCDTHENTFWIFLEYVGGYDLSHHVKKLDASDEKMTEERCRQVIRHLLLGVSYLHGQNIVHGAINGRKLLGSEWTPMISPLGASFRKAEAGVVKVSPELSAFPWLTGP